MSAGSDRSKKIAKRRAKQSSIVVRVNMTALARLDRVAASVPMSRANAIRIILEYAGDNPQFLAGVITEHMRKLG